MFRFFVVAALVLMLPACADVQVFSPTQITDKPSGNVEGLSTLLRDGEPVTLIFVHGVGDHCRGYAVGNENAATKDDTNAHAWLSDVSMKAIGLTPVANSQRDDEITAGEIHIGGPRDKSTNVLLIRKRDYLLSFPTLITPITVHAVELTWSPMTRWIKNTLLGYDASKISPFGFIPGGSDIVTCKNDPKDQIGQETPAKEWFSPPDRLAINANLKWGVLDRSLADAVIYAGSYGESIQRGVAAALCRVAGGQQQDAAPCAWPTARNPPASGRYVFVTHSLGSRILYDTMNNLSGGGQKRYPCLFPEVYVSQATPIVQSMINRTAGFYMMANQLTMLGTANVPVDAAFNLPQPFIEELDIPILDKQRAAGVGVEPTLANPDTRQTTMTSTDPLVRLLKLRSASFLARKLAPPTLAVVSFNDTNDLLTWHVPAWYVVPANTDGAYGVQFADVFVKNASHWFGLAEWPQSAHGGYFTNDNIWKVILCGAKSGKVAMCDN